MIYVRRVNKRRVRNENKAEIRENYNGTYMHSISILVCCTNSASDL